MDLQQINNYDEHDFGNPNIKFSRIKEEKQEFGMDVSNIAHKCEVTLDNDYDCNKLLPKSTRTKRKSMDHKTQNAKGKKIKKEYSNEKINFIDPFAAVDIPLEKTTCSYESFY